MPESDVLSALGGSSTTLLAKVASNRDLANAFIAMLWVIANTASARGARMDGIRIAAVTMTENRIRAHVGFHSIALAPARYITAQAQNLADHIGQENHDLHVFIRANPDIPAMLEGIVEKMDAYARDKGRRFEELAFSNGFMDDEDNFVLEIQKA